MGFAVPLALGGASLLGSFLSSNSSKKAAQSNQNQQSALDNQILGIYNNLMGKYNQVWGATKPAQALQGAEGFYTSEMNQGLSPAVIGSAESQFQQENATNLATLKDQLGPYTPNMPGMISDFQNNEIVGNVSLQQQLAALNQQTKQQGAQGLTGIAQGVMDWGSNLAGGVAGGLGTLASGFQQANEFNATNASANNPFGGLMNFALMYPNLFGGGGTTNPGQGGLGTTGGTGGAPTTSGGGLYQAA